MRSRLSTFHVPASLLSGCRIRLCAALFAVALPAIAAADDDYAIQFDRPKRVGDSYRITVKASQKRYVLSVADGKVLPAKDELLAAEFSADVEVLAVSPKGKAQKIRISDTHLAFRSAGRPVDVFPDGTEVMAERVGKEMQYAVGGDTANSLEKQALELVVRLGSDESSDDLILGTDQRQGVGGRWPLKPAEAAASLSTALGAKISPADVLGGCELKEVVPTEPGPALRIEGEVRVTKFPVPLPAGLTLRKGASQAKLSGLFPVDVRKGPLRESIEIETEIEANGENAGRPVQVKTKSITERDSRFTYR